MTYINDLNTFYNSYVLHQTIWGMCKSPYFNKQWHVKVQKDESNALLYEICWQKTGATWLWTLVQTTSFF